MNKALNEGPQLVTRRGKEVVVIISNEEYLRLQCIEPSISEFFRNSPLTGAEIDLERDKSIPNDVAF